MTHNFQTWGDVSLRVTPERVKYRMHCRIRASFGYRAGAVLDASFLSSMSDELAAVVKVDEIDGYLFRAGIHTVGVLSAVTPSHAKSSATPRLIPHNS